MRALPALAILCSLTAGARAQDAGPVSGPVCGHAAIVGEEIGEIVGDGDCGIASAVRITSVAGVRLEPAPTLTCGAARALHDWVAMEAVPGAAALGTRLDALGISASYVCRNRNRAATGKLSEHAFGRAIDISAFSLGDGRRVSVARDWGAPGTGWLLRWVRAGACGHFTTTLGPGADAFHADHFHFDIAERRNLYCR